MQTHDDATLLEMTSQGGEATDRALESFFKRPNLRQQAARRIRAAGGSATDAEEAFHEAFHHFHRQLFAGTVPRDGNLNAYFSGICFNTWRSRFSLKSVKNTELTDDVKKLDGTEKNTPEDDLMDEEFTSLLREISGLLGENCRKVMMLRYKGYRDAEIRRRPDINMKSTLRNFRNSCLERLRKKLRSIPHLWTLLQTLRYD